MWRVRFFKIGLLAAWLSHEFQSRGNWMASYPILSCSAPVGVTLQLLACLEREQLLAACSRESPARSSRESRFFLHTLEHFFTLSHSLPLQESHLNTGLLIAEIQANLTRNKANKMVDKIQPYMFFKYFFFSKVGNKVPILTFSFIFIIKKFIYYWIINFVLWDFYFYCDIVLLKTLIILLNFC